MKYTQEPSILQGMPSLLGFTPFPYFQNKWPLSKTLPSLEGSLKSKDVEVFNLGKIFSNNTQDIPFELRTQMQVTECEHKDRKHYAKNKCSICYQIERKKGKTAKCGHSDRKVFARNMCCSCYSREYKKYVKMTLKTQE